MSENPTMTTAAEMEAYLRPRLAELEAENEELRKERDAYRKQGRGWKNLYYEDKNPNVVPAFRLADTEREWGKARERAEAAEATMREVAEELRRHAKQGVIGYHTSLALADRLSPPPEKKTCPHPKACWGEMVCLNVEGGGQLCDDARLSPPPVVEGEDR